MVCDSHLAEDVTQGVFVALANNAGSIADRPVLSGWLHRTAQNIAAQTVRTEVRRHTREQEAAVMNELLTPDFNASWEDIAPHLDAALGELNEPDRDVLTLRFFERKSAQEMADHLGISAEAAQKRVSRSMERLRECFAQRGVTVGASSLAVVLSANAVQTAPAGLALTISTTAALVGTTVHTSTAIISAKIIAMTTLQKIIETATLAAAVGALIYESGQVAGLREQNKSLQQQQTSLGEQIQQLKRERDTASKRLVAASGELANVKKNPSEVLKLRGQMGVLRQENAAIGSKSGLSKVTADPATRKIVRDQQKMGMSMLYTDLAKRLELTPERTGQFNDLLADHVMDSIDLITQSLHDKKTRNEIDQSFSAQDSALHDKLSALVGPDGLAQYQDFSKNLTSTVTAQQFGSNLTGDQEAKADKQKQLLQAMQEATLSALAAAGLPADYQTLPMLNFRNIASEEQADLSLKLMGDTFDRVAARANSFLTPDELKKFQEFGAKAIENNRAMLLMNRKLMAPISQ